MEIKGFKYEKVLMLIRPRGIDISYRSIVIKQQKTVIILKLYHFYVNLAFRILTCEEAS